MVRVVPFTVTSVSSTTAATGSSFALSAANVPVACGAMPSQAQPITQHALSDFRSAWNVGQRMARDSDRRCTTHDDLVRSTLSVSLSLFLALSFSFCLSLTLILSLSSVCSLFPFLVSLALSVVAVVGIKCC